MALSPCWLPGLSLHWIRWVPWPRLGLQVRLTWVWSVRYSLRQYRWWLSCGSLFSLLASPAARGCSGCVWRLHSLLCLHTSHAAAQRPSSFCRIPIADGRLANSPRGMPFSALLPWSPAAPLFPIQPSWNLDRICYFHFAFHELLAS